MFSFFSNFFPFTFSSCFYTFPTIFPARQRRLFPPPYHSFFFYVTFNVHFLFSFLLYTPSDSVGHSTLLPLLHRYRPYYNNFFSLHSVPPPTVLAAHDRTRGHETDKMDHTNGAAVAMTTTTTTTSISSSPFLFSFFSFFLVICFLLPRNRALQRSHGRSIGVLYICGSVQHTFLNVTLSNNRCCQTVSSTRNPDDFLTLRNSHHAKKATSIATEDPSCPGNEIFLPSPFFIFYSDPCTSWLYPHIMHQCLICSSSSTSPRSVHTTLMRFFCRHHWVLRISIFMH